MHFTDPHSANAEGMNALRNANYPLAVHCFKAAIKLDGLAPPLWLNLANAYRQMEDDTCERDALEQALNIDRTNFTAWLRKAELHERLDERRQAIEAWSGVIEMAQQLEPVPAPLVAILDHGRKYVNAQGLAVTARIEAAIGSDITQLDPRDHRRMRAFIDRAAGKRRIYQNECAGLYYPFLPADEFFDDHHFPWFDNLTVHTDAIRAELLQLLEAPGEALRPYVKMDKGTPENKWTPLDRSLNWGACFLWEYGEPNEPVLERCPATRLALEQIPRSHIPGRAPSAFFSLLKPHAHIPPHTGVTNTRAIIHLPLIVPANCGFRVGGETRAWVEGQPFAFDDTIEHEAWNRSDELRAVLIFDVWNPHLSEAEQVMIARYYEATDVADRETARFN